MAKVQFLEINDVCYQTEVKVDGISLDIFANVVVRKAGEEYEVESVEIVDTILLTDHHALPIDFNFGTRESKAFARLVDAEIERIAIEKAKLTPEHRWVGMDEDESA